MIEQLDKIDHLEILNDFYKLEKSLNWDIYGLDGNQSKQCDLQHKDERSLIEQISETSIEKYIKYYTLCRTRLMWLGPKACYSLHKDLYKRIHIPLITNDQCFFIFKKGIVQHVPVGYSYLIDSTLEHTAMNGSNSWRLHLVGDKRS